MSGIGTLAALALLAASGVIANHSSYGSKSRYREYSCRVPYCRECDGAYTCEVCEDGYFLDDDKCSSCSEVSRACEECSDSDSCDDCGSGYFWYDTFKACASCSVEHGIECAGCTFTNGCTECAEGSFPEMGEMRINGTNWTGLCSL